MVRAFRTALLVAAFAAPVAAIGCGGAAPVTKPTTSSHSPATGASEEPAPGTAK